MTRIFCFLIAFCSLSFISTSQEKLTLEEAVLGQFRQFAPSRLEQLQWITGSDQYCYVKNNELWIGKTKGKIAERVLFTLDQLNTWTGGEKMTAMPQLHWISSEKFYFENKGSYYEMAMKADKAVLRVKSDDGFENPDYHSASGHLAQTKDNNLYIKKGDKNIAVTNSPAGIVNGQSISRNEYGIAKGTFWSEDGSKLAFYVKDERNVTNYPLTNYTTSPASVKEIKYPFAGNHSEHVSVGVFNVSTSKTIYLKPKEGGDNDQFYLTNLTWAPDNKTIYLVWLNRKTTDLKVLTFDSETGNELKMLFAEHNDKWLEPEHPVMFVKGKSDQFVWLSDRDGYRNLYLYSTNGKLIGQTKFTFQITEILGFDPAGENVFVMATGPVPTESVCYKINLKTMKSTLQTPVHGTHQVQVSASGEQIINVYSNLETPLNTEIYGNGKLIKSLLVAENPYKKKLIGKTTLFTIQSKDGSDLWCRSITPSNFDATKKYPVVIYVYGGPHAQLVTNSYLGGSSLWMNYLTEQGYIVFTLDNRGSAHRGNKFEQVIHRELGTNEMEDQMTGLAWLKKQPFVDASRIAVHGWSFGGFMTTNLMLTYPDEFKVGVAGGPVIDWSLYEVMYGERYMDTPAENPEGYKNTDLTLKAKNLKGSLLMIHGTDDDVVVMQHNMKFIKACIDAKKEVDFFAYPGHAHNVRGKDRVHLMNKVLKYIQERL